ncbi:MAG: 3'(2'),5'-bisphosphate nucleotidase CysQ, partial [Tidjanibacter sp.]|nr:3'(2'),5'-bisphosphate nucleotidase CysQ [Tidjanibacter sp.]
VDYYYRNSTTYEWDTAAGEAILRAAGGATLSHPEGTELDYNKESLANPHFTCQSKFF